MPQTILTSVRLNPSIHAEFKQKCETNNISISKTLKTLIVLFLGDDSLQNRVLDGVNHK